MKQALIAGGSGFIGQALRRHYEAAGYSVRLISRRPQHIPWGDDARLADALNGADVLINLAGKSVDCRYNARNKQLIQESRTRTTTALGRALQQCENPPSLWINASTATIYRHAIDSPQTETSGEIGTGFSVNVAKAWEEAFFAPELPRTRRAALRIAIALGPGGGVMTPYQNLVKLGLGGKQGAGKQMFSWIHIDDFCRIVRFLENRPDLAGVFNCASPNPVTNRELMRTLRHVMGIPFGLPATSWMLEIGAVFLQTETELILKSRWVLPQRLLEAGFEFSHPQLEGAFRSILKR